MGAQRLELKGLDRLLKALKDSSKPYIRVGILGSDATTAHTDEDGKSGLTNAEIGAIHEFGSENHPVRSFLRMPLSTYLSENLGSAGAFTKETMQQVIAEGTIDPWLEKVKIIAEETVAEAFDTGGFGEWPASDMEKKKVHQTLVETQQLRNSITAVIKRGGK